MNTKNAGPVWSAITAALAIAVAPLSAQNTPLDISRNLADGQASVTHSGIDIGPIGYVFDGNTDTLARTQSVNPMTVTLTFPTPRQLMRSRVWFLAGDNRWRIETADTVADLDAGVGTFSIALDWADGPEATWQDRLFSTPVTCRAVRLKLQRLSGDDYVHLNDWQLFLADSPFAITSSLKSAGAMELTWNSIPNRWYEVQSSPDLKSWESAGFQKGGQGTTTVQCSAPYEPRGFFRIREALPEERPSITKRVLVLNLNPILEAHGNQRLSQFLGWNDPHNLTPAYLNDLSTASGGYVQWEVAATVDLDLWPAATDGFRHNDTTYLQSWFNSQQFPWHSSDGVSYETLLDLPLAELANKTAHQMAASGEVDEIVVWGAPYMGFYESRMVGGNAYWCNAPPLVRDSRLYVVMGLNYERDVAEALHSFGHRSESILSHVYGSWSNSSAINHLWDRFTRVASLHGVSVTGCGNIHYPPNGLPLDGHGYDYQNMSLVTSEAGKWLAYPNLTGANAPVNATTWGGPDYHRNFLRWWFSHFPKSPGRLVDPTNEINNGKLNNWWGYIADMNEYAESR